VGDDYDEQRMFFARRTDKTIISKRIIGFSAGRKVRIASRIVDGQEGLKFATVGNAVILRRTPAGRYEIKATLLEDDRSIQMLTIQRFNNKSGPSDKDYFSFVGAEIETLLTFAAGVQTMPLDGPGKVHLSDKQLREIVLDHGQARRIFARNQELFLRLAEAEETTRDLVAVAYRRQQLKRFEALLREPGYFDAERTRLGRRPEDLWQDFFETNTWIFGYGLSYQFLSKLDDRKLQQTVVGHDLAGAGKRADALMKTRGIIGSLCFVEIKRHDTPLVGTSPYRPGVWSPSDDLAGGVSQVQATVHGAVEKLGRSIAPRDALGDPTGEVLFNLQPRSCLVIGSLAEFRTPGGVNEPKFRSFELFRQNTWRPEIITFDELLERARFIVEHGPGQDMQGPKEDADDHPF
jgi:hypothetical protein